MESLSAFTDFRYTGQKHDLSTGGLMYYNARYYLPELRRFVSSDSIVPGAGNPQAFNRYSYTLNNPVRFTDPSGHAINCALMGEASNCQGTKTVTSTFGSGGFSPGGGGGGGGAGFGGQPGVSTNRTPIPTTTPASPTTHTPTQSTGSGAVATATPATVTRPTQITPQTSTRNTVFGQGANIVEVGDCRFGATVKDGCESARWTNCIGGEWHCGIDIRPEGGGMGSPIYSPVNGTTLMSLGSEGDEWGNTFQINIQSDQYELQFIHVQPVDFGSSVEQGELPGYIVDPALDTRIYGLGPEAAHVHLTVIDRTIPRNDPSKYLNPWDYLWSLEW